MNYLEIDQNDLNLTPMRTPGQDPILAILSETGRVGVYLGVPRQVLQKYFQGKGPLEGSRLV